jgi:predicted AlkP superfamily pyrophosphatase or phosphodiesterase
MRKWIFILCAFLFFSPLFGQSKKPYVILISFDGFRSDYVDQYQLPNFQQFIKEGAAAEGLIPSFPSKTFPNHYTLVTGLYPGHHGLVDNTFYDPAQKLDYGMRIREAVTNPYFYGGTPLWRLCYEQGVKSASYFWVGSELKEEGLHPDYFLDYDQSIPFNKRTEQVIKWLKLPEAERPHLITLYFSSPDWESHQFGPVAEETKNSLLKMDSLVGNFMNGLKELNLPLNIFLVSDHGMKELKHQVETYIFLDEIIPSDFNIISVNGGTQAHIYTSGLQQRDSLYSLLSANIKNYTVLKREEFPERWHYDNERSGNILIVAKPGHYIVSGTRQKTLSSREIGATFGVHGYDPAKVRDMYGIFYAKGPNIKPGSKVPAFENIHVYPLLAAILGLKIPQIDGKAAVLESIRK